MNDPDSKKTEQENDAYWIALGRFVHLYSAAEAAMQVLLWDKAKVSSEVARAIFSGVKVREAINQVKRICEAEGDASYEIIKPAFDQLSTITSARNDILHFGSKFEDGKPQFVTNKRAAHTPDKIRHFPVSPEMLGQMTADLAVITTQIEMLRNQFFSPDPRFRDAV